MPDIIAYITKVTHIQARMQARLRQITRYPYPLDAENNLLPLAYTCFADPQTADRLEIETHAFRFIKNQQEQQIILLIIRDDDLENSQVDCTIHVPFNILRQFEEPHPEVIVNRRVLQMQSSLLPKLKVAVEVNFYFNEAFTMDKQVIGMVSESSFVFRNGEVYLDIGWLKRQVSQIRSVKDMLQIQQRIAEQESGHFRSYLRCYLEIPGQLESSDHFIFKKGTTKLNIKSHSLHPYNIYRTITLDHLQRQIFQLEPYNQVRKWLFSHTKESSILLLQADRNVGVPEFVHYISQGMLGLNYYELDCESVFSTQQFFRRLSWVSNLEDSLVLIYNLEWLLELYQAEQILTMDMKQIMAKVETELAAIAKKSLRRYPVILMYQGKVIGPQMFQEAHTSTLAFEKPLKAYIFKMVFRHFEHEHQHQHAIVEHCHDKFGWQTFKHFMRSQWKTVRQQSLSAIVKALSKLGKQAEAENLIEVSWDDVGGLETAKEEIIQTILLPIRHPEIFDQWIKPRTGLLFYGPPGTGKTLLGKCIAKECKMSFISVKGPELLNMYVGESEKNVRQIFERAAACRPCIVFMDELDALIPKRGNNSDSHQVMDRIVAELLMQMDLASGNQVFIIGATNRPDLLDPSILRPGRFDKQIYLGITTDIADRIKILKAQTRHLALEAIDWQQLLSKLPANLTGADFYGLTSKAVMAAAQRVIDQYQRGISHEKITITQQDFLLASESVKPSVTEGDLRRYDQLKKIYS